MAQHHAAEDTTPTRPPAPFLAERARTLVQHQGELQSLRLAFPQAVRGATEVRQALVQMVQQARAAEA
jgi:putative heme iron utilization protein